MQARGSREVFGERCIVEQSKIELVRVFGEAEIARAAGYPREIEGGR